MNITARVLGSQGLIKATAGRATVIDKQVSEVVRHWGMLLNTRIKAKASGRPGPNAPTGDYRRSWTHRFSNEGGTATSTNGTNAPQGRRLEFGFTGADSLGRVYDQPPYPHAGPALDEIEPPFIESVKTVARSIG